MKLTLRILIPVIFIVGLLVVLSERHFGALQERWFLRDLDARSRVAASLVEDEIESAGGIKKLRGFLTRLTRDENMMALGFCTPDGRLAVKTSALPRAASCGQALTYYKPGFVTRNEMGTRLHIGYFPIRDAYGLLRGHLILVRNMAFITARMSAFRQYVFLAFIVFVLALAAIVAWMAELSWKNWLFHMRALVRGFRGAVENSKGVAGVTAYTPIVKDLRRLVRDLESKRVARDEALLSWTPKVLKDVLNLELADEQVIIVSNREPFIHKRRGDSLEVQRPASGLVTALEPVMEACSGVWVAHGSGDADRDVVDENDKIRVPPECPGYSLRRVWLSPEEEQGYYYGFANEGIWPLCHIAHTRPIFRSEDFEHYKAVNQKFADVVVEEAKSDEPVILIQDYHFTLMPRMIRKKLPKAVIITFWHIPWPNPEVFGICPWREELIEGLLGSSIVGFHTQFHCNNFFETVDRFLECRIDREGSAVSYLGQITGVKPYPISIEWPPKWVNQQKTIAENRSIVRHKLGLPAHVKLGVGVDRLDYTKGIVERFLAIETFLKKYPEWVGKFSFVQIAAPSRSRIPSYKNLEIEVINLAERINSKFQGLEFKPIILKIEHHEPPDVYAHLRGCDICYVSSLHDGMNLVAKEFIASREDEQGVLILSSFTGASRELPEALIVNPYNIDQAAENLHTALTMSSREQKERMKSMRGLISEFNVYRWAGRMLMDAAAIKKRNKFHKWNRSHARIETSYA